MFVLCALYSKGQKAMPGQSERRNTDKVEREREREREREPRRGMDVCVVCKDKATSQEIRDKETSTENSTKREQEKDLGGKKSTGFTNVSLLFSACCTGTGLSEGPISRPEEPYRARICVIKYNSNPLHLQRDRQTRFD
jgi:hypothetical protein